MRDFLRDEDISGTFTKSRKKMREIMFKKMKYIGIATKYLYTEIYKV